MPDALRSPRLVLDVFSSADAKAVERLVGDAEIAKGVIGIPHPYPAGGAEHWIAACHDGELTGKSLTWAVRLHEPRALIGCVTLFLAPKHQRAEIAFWIGRPFWKYGYATEAASVVVAHAFQNLALRRIDGGHFTWNQASARVLKKLGMKQEGVRRKFMMRADVAEDVAEYGLLREDYVPHYTAG